MKMQVKSSLIIISTLLIGIIFGMVISRAFMMRTFERRPDFGNPDFFYERIEARLGIEDSQKEEVRAILQKHFENFRELHMHHMDNSEILLDSLKTDLNKVLTPEQLEKFEKQLDRIKRFGPFGKPPFHKRERRPKGFD